VLVPGDEGEILRPWACGMSEEPERGILGRMLDQGEQAAGEFHTRTVLSALAVASWPPSALQATPRTDAIGDLPSLVFDLGHVPAVGGAAIHARCCRRRQWQAGAVGAKGGPVDLREPQA
jgi:hypothetical protein